MTHPNSEVPELAATAWRTNFYESLPNGKIARVIIDASDIDAPAPDWEPLYATPPLPASAASEMREALENAKGLLDTPIGRRRHEGDPLYAEVVASIRAALHPDEAVK